MTVTFADMDVATLTEDVWLSMLHLPATRIDATPVLDGVGRTFIGVVNISGDWKGAVALHLPCALAERVARSMFSLGDQMPTLADLQDSVGELANMTGGGIKALVPGVCHLSLPTVVEGVDFSVRFPGMDVIERVAFHCGGSAFVVSIAGAK